MASKAARAASEKHGGIVARERPMSAAIELDELTLRPSRIERGAVLALHALAGFALLPTALPAGVKAALGIGLALSLAHLYRPAAQRLPVVLRGRHGGILEIRRGDTRSGQGGAWEAVALRPESRVTTTLTLLVLRPSAGRRAHRLRIWPDSLAPEDYRRLRVWLLRWSPQNPAHA